MQSLVPFPMSQTLRISDNVFIAASPPPGPSGLDPLFLPEGKTMDGTALKALRLSIQASIETHLTTGRLKLFQNNFTPNFDTVIGDFTEATFVGYAEIAAAGAPDVGIDPATGDLLVAWGDGSNFLAGAIVGPQTIYGWYVTNTAENSSFMAGRFEEAIVIDEAGDLISLGSVIARIPPAVLRA